MEMSATQKVGQEIKKVRYRIGLTQKELGKLIGKSESQIGAYENASASITLAGVSIIIPISIFLS